MNYAVVDTGSNTIRMSVYKWENGELSELYTEAVFANLAGHIEENSLTDEGVSVCCDAILYHQKKAQEFDAPIYVFATAAIRNAANCAQIVEKVKEKTGINLQVLSGTDEAELSFLGACDDFPVDSGIMADVGGGSSEIILFEKGKILATQSVPLGSLKAYKNFVSEELPTKAESDAIKTEILKYIKSNKAFNNVKSDCLCLVGGGVRAARKLSALVLKREDLGVDRVDAMLDAFISDRVFLDVFEKIVPKRKYTICPGLAIYSAIGRHFDADKIYISDKGIKEGYVKKYLVH